MFSGKGIIPSPTQRCHWRLAQGFLRPRCIPCLLCKLLGGCAAVKHWTNSVNSREINNIVSDVCSTFPKDSDRCGDPKPRFFYNSTSQACEPFTYRGCSWFRNRFYTIEECQRYCGVIEKPGSCLPNPRNITLECLASCLHDGNCPGDQKCCSYGCALRCSEPVKDICKMPPDCGPCHGKFKSWYYDERDQKCKRFTYGGCLGNKNNFKKRSECMARCRPAGSS